ncbi:MAG: N-acetylmuramoyl-L-alanine amidase, partial [Bacteroidetes bacterium]|nr:N-acetylmuramoyl-L-alanine amidase [Bacteroidota bacterium]
MKMRSILVFAIMACVVFFYSFREEEKVFQNEVKTILIDPGHGGKDKGSTWDTLVEKNLVLDFCKYFEKVNINPGYKLVFLRNSDEYFSFNGRVEKINQLKPDIIVSIHHSMNVDSTLSGVQVFYCRESYNSERSLVLA